MSLKMDILDGNVAKIGFGTETEAEPEVSEWNGFFEVDSKIFPVEMMEIVLSYADCIPALRLVCKNWNEIVKKPTFWKLIMDRNGQGDAWALIREHIPQDHPDGWQVYRSEFSKQFLSRNLVKNPCGAAGFDDWELMSGREEFADGWEVANNLHRDQFGTGAAPFAPSGFVSSTQSCSKEQLIDLWAEGFTPAVMRTCLPFTISWSEWVQAGQHNGVYESRVTFVGRDHYHIAPFTPYEYFVRKNIPFHTPWTLVNHDFHVDESNAFELIDVLRYFHIYHGAMAAITIDPGSKGPTITNSFLQIKLKTD